MRSPSGKRFRRGSHAGRRWRAVRRVVYEFQPRPVYLSVASFFDSPPPNFREWIEFHRAVGVERFYIGYPENHPEVERILRADLTTSDVTFRPCAAKDGPAVTLLEMAKQVRRATRWLALIAPEDYLFSPVESDLRKPLRDFEDCPAVAVFPFEYPPEAETDEPKDAYLPAMQFRRVAPSRSYCLVANPVMLREVRPDGWLALRKGRTPVTERKQIPENGFTQNASSRLFRVNRMDRGQRGFFGKREADPRGGNRISAARVHDPAFRPEALGPETGHVAPATARSPATKAGEWARAARHIVQAGRGELPRRYYLCMGMVFKDAARYLVEWIEFHRLVGFEHFFLYNNGSTDEFRDVLRPYRDAGLVTLGDWPPGKAQVHCLEYCARVVARKTRWLALLDDDEFLFPAKASSLADELSDFEDFAGLAIPWLMFGSSGHRAAPGGLVTENFTRRAASVSPIHKLIVDPMFVSRILTPHLAEFRPGYVCVNEKKTPERFSESRRRSIGRFRLHHYYTKSYEEAEWKVRKRGYVAESANDSKQQRNFLRAALGVGYNRVEDLTIHRYLAPLREAVANPARVKG